VEHLKDGLIEEWHRFPESIIDKATKERRGTAWSTEGSFEKGGHFEHKQ